MGLISRAGAAAVLVTAIGGVLLGCGGSSVADADAPDPTRRAPAPQSPFCAAAQANLEAIRPLNGLVARGQVAPEELERSVAAVRRSGQDMVYSAPNEIRTDVERTVQALDLQLDALVASGGDQSALSRDPELANRLNSPEFTGAGERVRTYVERNCTTGATTTRR
ncbi:MAG TPA: hypothetical protein VKZ81_17845 [Pseudonocardia sp.]|jgi:hypothetical protein|uniref:hypothetical protein n=1 Tax=Pseudonocardia sp. TaxID=60912 RepID=UPI002B4B2821|nr:hypothetical protein [Pseudonocardia sp.]HLU57321.1 hypothetical protein [Pseudonocardia sp.]